MTAEPVVPEEDWRRLDAKMLLVHPVGELTRLAVPLLAIVLIGSGGIDIWHSAVVAIPIALGIWRWVTTQFRITEEHLELSAGLVARHVKRARLDKVRTVALDASPIHRVLSLAKVRIGTGDDEGLELNALGTAEARELRESLLHRTATAVEPDGTPVAPVDDVLLRFDPSWIRLAPFTGTGVLIALAALGATAGPLQQPLGRVIEDVAGSADGTPVVALVLGGLVLLLVVLSVLSIAGYSLTNWGFTFSRDRAGRSWHISKGMLTRRETSVDTSRVRGISVCRGVGLRLVGGATARALVTGLKEDREQGQKGSAPVAPAAPYAVVRRLCLTLLGDDAALDAPLVPHGSRARRRQLLRPLRLWLVLQLGVLVAVLLGADPWWIALLPLPFLVLGVVIGTDRFRGLGHLLTEHHLVIGAPRVNRHRNLLLRRGIIGWKLEQTWFQRRTGLVTLVATTAAGEKTYALVDLTEDAAVPLADQAVPGLVAQFLA